MARVGVIATRKREITGVGVGIPDELPGHWPGFDHAGLFRQIRRGPCHAGIGASSGRAGGMKLGAHDRHFAVLDRKSGLERDQARRQARVRPRSGFRATRGTSTAAGPPSQRHCPRRATDSSDIRRGCTLPLHRLFQPPVRSPGGKRSSGRQWRRTSIHPSEQSERSRGRPSTPSQPPRTRSNRQ